MDFSDKTAQVNQPPSACCLHWLHPQRSYRIIRNGSRKERKKILSQVGAVIEKPDLYKYLTAYENLSFFARMSGSKISKKELIAQLEMVGLGGSGKTIT